MIICEIAFNEIDEITEQTHNYHHNRFLIVVVQLGREIDCPKFRITIVRHCLSFTEIPFQNMFFSEKNITILNRV